jgi:putative phosphoesterase
MRIAVFADTHGNKNAIRDTIINSAFEGIIHLGDGVGDGYAVSEEFGIPFYGVAGNEDYGVHFPEKHLLRVYSWTLLLIHGHQWDINSYHAEEIWEKHFSDMARMARNENARVLLFGHTHEPLLKEREGILFCNPGNQYIGSSKPLTFAIMDAAGDALHISIVERSDDSRFAICKSIVLKAI